MKERSEPRTRSQRDVGDAAHEAQLEKAVSDARDDMDSKVDRDLDEMLGRDSEGRPTR